MVWYKTKYFGSAIELIKLKIEPKNQKIIFKLKKCHVAFKDG